MKLPVDKDDSGPVVASTTAVPEPLVYALSFTPEEAARLADALDPAILALLGLC